MTVSFTNHCRYVILLDIDGGESITVCPFETRSVIRPSEKDMRVLVKRDRESKKESYMYHLILETEYLFTQVPDGAAFTVSREKIQFSLIATYDRLFINCDDAVAVSESHKVLSEEPMKKAFKKSRVTDFLLESLLSSIGLIIVLLLVGISLTFIGGWKIAAIYFPLAVLLLLLINWIIDKGTNKAVNRLFQTEDETADFYHYFENDFIQSYYSDVNRVPYKGTIEIN